MYVGETKSICQWKSLMNEAAERQIILVVNTSHHPKKPPATYQETNVISYRICSRVQ